MILLLAFLLPRFIVSYQRVFVRAKRSTKGATGCSRDSDQSNAHTRTHRGCNGTAQCKPAGRRNDASCLRGYVTATSAVIAAFGPDAPRLHQRGWVSIQDFIQHLFVATVFFLVLALLLYRCLSFSVSLFVFPFAPLFMALEGDEL